MPNKKDSRKHPTNRANTSQKTDEMRKISSGVDKRGGQSPK